MADSIFLSGEDHVCVGVWELLSEGERVSVRLPEVQDPSRGWRGPIISGREDSLVEGAQAQEVESEVVPGDRAWHSGVDEILIIPGDNGIDVEVLEEEGSLV